MTAARWKVIAVLVTALLVAGCSEEPRPRFEEPTDSPGSPAASDSTSASAEPEPWQVKSRAGAEAFAEHWIETFNEAVVTGETHDLAAISAEACTTCTSVIDRVVEMYANGGFFKGNGYQILYATPEKPDARGRATVVLRIKRAAERYKDSADERVKTNPPSKASYSAELRWVRGAWKMERLVVFR